MDHPLIPYLAILFAAAILYDANYTFAKLNIRDDSVRFLPLWTIDGGWGESLMVGLRVASMVGFLSAWIGAFVFITPWYLALALIPVSVFLVPIGVVFRFIPSNVILRLFMGIVLLAFTFLNFVFGWMP